MNYDGEIFGYHAEFFGLFCCDGAVLNEMFFNFVNECFSSHEKFPFKKPPASTETGGSLQGGVTVGTSDAPRLLQRGDVLLLI